MQRKDWLYWDELTPNQQESLHPAESRNKPLAQAFASSVVPAPADGTTMSTTQLAESDREFNEHADDEQQASTPKRKTTPAPSQYSLVAAAAEISHIFLPCLCDCCVISARRCSRRSSISTHLHLQAANRQRSRTLHPKPTVSQSHSH